MREVVSGNVVKGELVKPEKETETKLIADGKCERVLEVRYRVSSVMSHAY